MAIVKLSNLYRYILTSSDGGKVSIDQEIEVVKTYLALEKLRFGARLDFSVQVAGDTALIQLLGLLIQPLVENSIRHGITPKLGPGKVSVVVKATSSNCQIVVEDDGDGNGKPSMGTGFGLRNVQERLNLTYGDSYTLGITKSPGYRVEINLPIGG